jgi:prepilin-type N-terminal cleavage/methylation domain-containing protein
MDNIKIKSKINKLTAIISGLTTDYRKLITEFGFTLVEMMVVVAIIALLTGIGFTSFQAVTKNGRNALRKSDLEQIRSALEIYKSDNNSYPVTSTPCMAAIPSVYLNKYPLDPKPTTNKYCYSSGANNLSYQICAQLENSADPTIAQCTPADCGGKCNYRVTNP